MKDDVAQEAWDALTLEEQERLIAFAAERMAPQMMQAIAETGVVHFEVGEMIHWPTEPLPQGDYETPEAVGYMCAVDRDARTVRVSSARVEEAVADLGVPFWLYHFAVELGAQRPVADIWPRARAPFMAGRPWGKSILPDLLAQHFYASKPPDP